MEYILGAGTSTDGQEQLRLGRREAARLGLALARGQRAYPLELGLDSAILVLLLEHLVRFEYVL